MAPDRRPIQVLILGDTAAVDFQPVGVCLREHVASDNCRTASEVEQARQIVLGESWHPDLIIVQQTWPDQFSPDDVLALLALAPLARIICFYGPWCDSDGRTRNTWPLAVRVPAARAARRVISELALLAGTPPPVSVRKSSPTLPPTLLPLTASRTEIFEYDFDSAPLSATAPMSVVIDSPDVSWRRMLADGLVRVGHIVAGKSHQEPAAPDVILWDADPWNAEQKGRLTTLRAQNPQAKIIACAGFPRDDVAIALTAARADRVWFKLDSLAGLLAHLERADAGTR